MVTPVIIELLSQRGLFPARQGVYRLGRYSLVIGYFGSMKQPTVGELRYWYNDIGLYVQNPTEPSVERYSAGNGPDGYTPRRATA